MASEGRIPMIEVVVTDELDLWGVSRLDRILDDAISLQPSELVVDLAECSSMDAAAIAILLEAHRRTRRQGGRLALRSPSVRLRRNLQLARVDQVLHILPSAEGEAEDIACGAIADGAETSADDPS